MMAKLEAIRATASVDVARRKGGARAALVGSIFGAFWIFDGAYWGGLTGTAPLIGVALCAVAFVAWPAARLRSLRRSRISATDGGGRVGLGVAFWVDVAIECLACIGAVMWLAHIHRLDLIPQSFGVIIGLHFLPIARIFRRPIYYATGSVMALGALASLALPAGNLRNLAACAVIGLCLWASAAVNLLWRGSPTRLP